ncbi:hypothetical protein ANN_27906 [Periplaneta americana]|uniref:C2H2-type domain-containing protein n=1 Tax=Periplaneta americana TaxID=6978 RepID=A0ABQ8RVK2_PERAM|nr:hypothetical protein ANN_27906 [Periplaneta americana]
MKCVVMDVIKKEPDIDPLAIHWSDDTDTDEKKPLSEEGNVLDLDVTGIKTECVDHSYDHTSETKVEETAVPTNFVSVKCEAEEELCDSDTVKDELKLDVTAEEDEILPHRGYRWQPHHWAYFLQASNLLEGHLLTKKSLQTQNTTAYNGNDPRLLKDKRWKRKNIMNFATWDVHSICHKDDQLDDNLNKKKVHIAVISEPQRKLRGTKETNNYIEIYSGVRKNTSKWADNRQATNFECTLTPCDLNCGFLFTNSDVYYANQDFSNFYSNRNETPFVNCIRALNCVSTEYSVTESIPEPHLYGQWHRRKENQELQSDGGTDDSFKCNICGKLLQTLQSQRKHLQIHTAERTFKCDTCGKYFLRLDNLKSHVTTHSGEKAFKCDVCGKCFARSRDLTVHARTHSGEKPFKCNVCGKCFVRSGVLSIHARTHSGSKPYKCDICGKSFGHSGILTEHARTHSGEKPYQCDVCGKCFARSRELIVHSRIHSGEKPYKCDICGKCFLQSPLLTVHKRTHSGEKPYKCDVCGKCFVRSSYLTMHIRTHSRVNPYK